MILVRDSRMQQIISGDDGLTLHCFTSQVLLDCEPVIKIHEFIHDIAAARQYKFC